MTTMYSPGQYRKLKAERDELREERDVLLLAAKNALSTWTPSDSVTAQELRYAIDKAEGR